MATLVFDIETVGKPWNSFDSVTQSEVTKWVQKTSSTQEEKELRINQIKNELGFSPLTGEVVALGVYDVERNLGSVYFQGNEKDFTDEMFVYKARSEKQILEDFWDTALSYDVFVSFNGRAFDVPFLLHRSIALNVRPSIQLSQKRYLSTQSVPYHIDLQDELTFYGAMNKRPSLHMFCQAYGIESPKLDVTGDDVAELFRTKKFSDIARYNAKDVIATTHLFNLWLENLAPHTFLNRTL